MLIQNILLMMTELLLIPTSSSRTTSSLNYPMIQPSPTTLRTPTGWFQTNLRPSQGLKNRRPPIDEF